MSVMMVLGSRDRKGQTARAGNSFLAGVGDAGGSTDQAFLPEMRVERCRQCESDGWGTCRSGGVCATDDDFAGLVARVRQADAVVFATPVYFGDLSESLRAFLDRMRRICMHEAGRDRIAGKPAVGICVAGGRGGGAPSCAASLDKVLRTCGFDVVDMILARRQNVEAKLPILRAAGKWLESSSR